MTLSTLVLLTGLTLTAGTGDPAPEIGAKDLSSGDTVTLEGLKGKVVLIDFWATWCDPCKVSLPRYQVLAQKLQGEAFSLVAVSVDEDRANVERFVKDNKLTFTVVHDPEGKTAERYGPEKMPTAYLVDKEGKITQVYGGFHEGDESSIERDIRTLLPPRTTP